MAKTQPHEIHPEIIKRLRRADGHLKKIIEMIEKERPCLDVAQQMQAVCAALEGAKLAFIRDHIEHCLEHAVEPGGEWSARKNLAEFKEITKYL